MGFCVGFSVSGLGGFTVLQANMGPERGLFVIVGDDCFLPRALIAG